MILPAFRPATPADKDRICAIWHPGWHEAHAAIVPPELTERRTLASFQERLEGLIHGTRVGLMKGEVSGFSTCLGDELEQFYVAPTARSSGFAATLLVDAETSMADAGVTIARLKCGIGNNRAAAFYRKHGWREAGTVTATLDTSRGPFALEVWRFDKEVSGGA